MCSYPPHRHGLHSALMCIMPYNGHVSIHIALGNFKLRGERSNWPNAHCAVHELFKHKRAALLLERFGKLASVYSRE